MNFQIRQIFILTYKQEYIVEQIKYPKYIFLTRGLSLTHHCTKCKLFYCFSFTLSAKIIDYIVIFLRTKLLALGSPCYLTTRENKSKFLCLYAKLILPLNIRYIRNLLIIISQCGNLNVIKMDDDIDR